MRLQLYLLWKMNRTAMKYIIELFCIFLLALFFGCQKNEDSSPMEIPSPSEPPLSFSLLEVADDATNVSLLPVLSWQSAENPEGTGVTYDLYLGTALNPSTLYESDINGTSIALVEKLNLLTEYRWKVIAKDAQGKTSQSPIQKFTTRNLNHPETPITTAAGFTPRSRHSTAVFDDRLWLIGGRTGALDFSNEVWSSEDGEDWVLRANNPGFSERWGHTTVVFDNKLWVIAGFQDFSFVNDVWYSEDGENWVEATGNAEFSPREGHTSFVFDNKIWLVGGGSLWTVFNDVWYSSDGIHWTEATANAAFSERGVHASAVFNNAMWVMGGSNGTALNDVWNSPDGITWTQTNTESSFSSRLGATAVNYDDKLWIAGGNTDSDQKNDLWFSTNGINWHLTGSLNPIFNRTNHGMEVFENKIWIIGGENEDGYLNDVWVLD